MVKKVSILLLVFLIGLGVSALLLNKKSQTKDKKHIKQTRSADGQVNKDEITNKTSIFVPYWSLEEGDFDQYNRLIYFGVAGTTNGIDENEAGFLNLENFNEQAVGKEKYLAVRLTDSETNFAVLKNKTSQQKIVEDAVKIAKNYGFSGIVLDLELFTLFGTEIPEQINEFVQLFHRDSKDNGLRLSVAIYGDVFYRKRLFDVKTIAENSDEIMVMAYDFHKSIGEPGPNFPLEGKEKYGYDFKTMINDFLAVVPVEKLTVIFGMYGYEWTVDEQKRPLKAASSLTLNQIREKYLSDCTLKNCVIFRDKQAGESEVNYVDDEARLHIVWFEDDVSVDTKKEYLMEEGIGSFSYWAYSYF